MLEQRHIFRIICLTAFIYISNGFFMDTITKIPKVIPDIITDPLEKVVFRNKCIEDIGCFFTGPPFYHAIIRPLSFSPYGIEKMKTKFRLFTPTEKENGTIITLDLESLANSSYNENLPVKFITHGFLTSLTNRSNPFFRMKDALLNQGDYNVFVVDWTESNGHPYPQAVANTRVVGAQIAQMVEFLQNETGLDPKNVHLIGHSLGAHVSGFAGERIPNLGRISGLDPAGPYFRLGDPRIRLDKSDAEFMDIIHTDIGSLVVQGLGIKEPIGDIDFFPNGGWHQLGCEPTLLNFTVAGINVTAVGAGEGITALMATSCDHSRSVELYTASISSISCKFMATQCEDYEKFEKGECENNTQIEMGFFAEKNNDIPEGQKFYLKTGGEFPFCLESKN